MFDRRAVRIACSLSLAFAVAWPVTAAKPKAEAAKKAFFRLDKITSTFTHACGFRVASPETVGATSRVVVLASIAVDCAAFDQGFSPVKDLEAAVEQAKGACVVLNLADDGSRADGSWRSAEPSDAFSFGGQGSLTVTRNDERRVEGRYRTEKPESFFDKTFEFDLPFAVDILSGALEGTALPAGGGDPGKAYKAYLKAVAGRDAKALQKAVSKEQAEEIAHQVEMGVWKEIFDIKRSLEFKLATISGGLLKKDRAALDVEGTSFDGDKFRGRVFLVLEDGAWKVASRDTRLVFD